MKTLTQNQLRAQTIKNLTTLFKSEGSMKDAFDKYLVMHFEYEISEYEDPNCITPRVQALERELTDSQMQDEVDMRMWDAKTPYGTELRLSVHLTPTIRINFVNGKDFLCAYFNSIATPGVIRNVSVENVARCIIQMKEQMDTYRQEFRAMVKEVQKKMKRHDIEQVAIKAFFAKEMEGYPGLRYEFFEQNMRVRIKVYIPDTNLDVMLDAWFESWRVGLAVQIESLKVLLDAHQRSCLKFFNV